MNRKIISITAVAATTILASTFLQAQEAARTTPSPAVRTAPPSIEAVARKLLQANQTAIVWISAVRKVQQQDQPVQLTGCVVDESGLIVCSLRVLNPSVMASDVPGNVESEMESIKIILPDGKEIPADLVLKDVELDIAVLRVQADAPEAKGIKWKALDLKNSTEAAVVEKGVELTRMNAVGNRQPYIRIVSIVGMTTKPRKYYFVDSGNMSCPVFGADGKVIGLSVLRTCPGLVPTQIQAGIVVLPAANVLKVVEQAAKVKEVPVAPKKKAAADDTL